MKMNYATPWVHSLSLKSISSSNEASMIGETDLECTDNLQDAYQDTGNANYFTERNQHT